MTKTGVIYGINGPVVSLEGDPGFQMNEMVYVGKENLVGEVIGLTSQKTTIQVYEETSGLKPGEVVTGTGAPVSVTLAPGILSNIFDGIERPLSKIAERSGYSISRGISVDSLDTSKKWDTHITVKKGERLMPGTIIAEVPETRAIVHKVMVPPDVEGYILEVVPDGSYTIREEQVTVQLIDGTERKLTMTQKWPIRVPRHCQAFSGHQTADHGAADSGHHVPPGKGRHGGDSRRFRHRQDHDPAPDRQVVRRGCDHLHRLRGAGQRDDPGVGGVHGVDRSQERRSTP